MRLTPRNTLLLGAALILLANAVALAGVYFNRRGKPEARMSLSQRELVNPWIWGLASESSGLALALNWRINDPALAGYAGSHAGGIADWLDEKQLAALGFDTYLPADDRAAQRRFERQLPREVLLVLEFNGAAWQAMLEAARQNAARNEAAYRANADSKEFAGKAKGAQEQLKREETSASRLFAVDAGLDRAALRARYPDRGRFLILKGMVRPRLLTRDGKLRVTGYVSALAVTRINVPHALRATLEPLLRQQSRSADGLPPGFEATLAVGQRLEPWLESVRVPR